MQDCRVGGNGPNFCEKTEYLDDVFDQKDMMGWAWGLGRASCNNSLALPKGQAVQPKLRLP